MKQEINGGQKDMYSLLPLFYSLKEGLQRSHVPEVPLQAGYKSLFCKVMGTG